MLYIKHIFCTGVILCSLLVGSYDLAAQLTHDTSITKNRKNIVRVNLTPTLLFGIKNYVAGYERVFNGHNSVSLNLGYLTMPKIFSAGLSKYGVNRERSNFGYSVAIDYRRYFKKRNRGLAPDGLYVGPYFASYNYYTRNRFTFDEDWGLGNSFVELRTSVNVMHAGIQLGYQFILYKRIALDFIMLGPGLGFYKMELDLEGGLDPQVEEQFIIDLAEAAVEYYPGLEILMGRRNFVRKGNLNQWGPGYRLVIQLGFLF